jgi:hypothetical protein
MNMSGTQRYKEEREKAVVFRVLFPVLYTILSSLLINSYPPPPPTHLRHKSFIRAQDWTHRQGVLQGVSDKLGINR